MRCYYYMDNLIADMQFLLAELSGSCLQLRLTGTWTKKTGCQAETRRITP
jgi:hypothetical protein